MKKKQDFQINSRMKSINNFALENNLNLSDLQELDCCLLENIDEPDLIKYILLSIEHSKSDVYPSYMKIINSKTSLMRRLYSLGYTSILHALIISLFLRSNNEKMKNIIKKYILSSGIETLKEYFNEDLLTDLIKGYQEDLFNKLYLEKENFEFVRQINEYYAVSTEEILQEIQKIGMQFGI